MDTPRFLPRGKSLLTLPLRKPPISAPTSSQTPPSGMQAVWQRLKSSQVSEDTAAILLASWKKCTPKQYSCYHDRWFRFFQVRKTSMFQPTVNQVLDFLTCHFKKGLSYSNINTARSALSALLDYDQSTTIGSHPCISRFLKGVYALRPPLPKYKRIWDVFVDLNHLRTLHPTAALNLQQLTHKLVMLIALISAQRLQSLEMLDTMKLCMDDKQALFLLPNTVP